VAPTCTTISNPPQTWFDFLTIGGTGPLQPTKNVEYGLELKVPGLFYGLVCQNCFGELTPRKRQAPIYACMLGLSLESDEAEAHSADEADGNKKENTLEKYVRINSKHDDALVNLNSVLTEHYLDITGH
jgi:hypothetical protein